MTDDLVEAFALEGCEGPDKWGPYWIDDFCRYRVLNGYIRAGRREYFDRWANSEDAYIKVQRDVLSNRAAIRALRESCKYAEPTWGASSPAACFYRQMRKQLKQEARDD